MSVFHDTKWAIRPDSLQRLATPDLSALDLSAFSSAVSQPTTKHGTTAVIKVHGPLFRYETPLSRFFGSTTYDGIKSKFESALGGESISKIILDIDSPGGEVSGCNELASSIFAARGKKPIHAHISGDGCSAAYWLASACERISASPTAIAGSIGVIGVVSSASDDNEVVFVSSQTPHKAPDPKTDDGKSLIQGRIDSLCDVFIDDVARYRGISSDEVTKRFGKGATFVGSAAVTAGLVDEVGDLDRFLGKAPEATTAPQSTAESERTRILSLMALGGPKDLTEKAIHDGLDAGTFAISLLKSMKASGPGSAYLDSLRESDRALNDLKPAIGDKPDEDFDPRNIVKFAKLHGV